MLREQSLNDRDANANLDSRRKIETCADECGKNGCCLAVLALPFMELAVFIAVAGSIGFLWALLLVVATSMAGAMVLRHAGGNHIARVRVAMGDGGFTALQADGAGTATLLAGILLLIPGFITDVLGLLLLLAPLRRALGALFGRKGCARARRRRGRSRARAVASGARSPRSPTGATTSAASR